MTLPMPWRRSADQVETIARATFSGFLESDLMPPGMQAPALIWAAAFFVAPALCLPAIAMIKYPFIRKYHPAMLEVAFWGDRLVYLLLSAGAMGLISVVLWDTLFPARRDAYVLAPMPIPLGIQMLGRLSGLVLLFAGFTVALNAIPSVAFPAVASGSFIQIPRGIAGHIVSSIAASAFVFFSVTSAQGLVILAFGRRAAARLASLAQAGAVLLFLLSLLFLDPVRGFVVDAHGVEKEQREQEQQHRSGLREARQPRRRAPAEGEDHQPLRRGHPEKDERAGCDRRDDVPRDAARNLDERA